MKALEQEKVRTLEQAGEAQAKNRLSLTNDNGGSEQESIRDKNNSYERHDNGSSKMNSFIQKKNIFFCLFLFFHFD